MVQHLFLFQVLIISASQSLVDTYIVILKTRNTLETVIEKSNLPYSYNQLSSMISSSSVNSTEVFKVTVTSSDPVEACKIANSIAEVLPDKIQKRNVLIRDIMCLISLLSCIILYFFGNCDKDIYILVASVVVNIIVLYILIQ